MFALVIKEKTGIIGGWLEVDGAEHVVQFGDLQEDVEQAIEIQAIWSDWMDKEVDSMQNIFNQDGVGVSLRPYLVESIALVYTRS